MSNPPRDGGGGGGGEGNKNNESDKTVAKTAGFVVFSGIAMSILKAISNPFNNSNQCNTSKMEPLDDSTQIGKTRAQPPPPCCKSSPPPPLQAPSLQNPVTISVEQNVAESTAKIVKIVKGDTLWGLSREYGVSIEAIKEANGLSGDTIYAGKKLVIP